MTALEFKAMVEGSTSKGGGNTGYMIDYWPIMYTLYTITIKESGECWQMTHKDFQASASIAMGIRRDYSRPPLKATIKNGMKQVDELTLKNINKS